MITPRQHVMNALMGENNGKPPFTIYECFAQPCTTERILRDKGMCVVHRTTSYRMVRKNVRRRDIYFDDELGNRMHRIEYITPVGTLTAMKRVGHNTEWMEEYPFKDEDDYKVLQFIYNDTEVFPAYEAAAKLQDDLGEDYAVRDGLPLEPLQGLISGEWMGPETFCYEWHDNRDEILKLYDAAVRINRRCAEIIAGGPLAFSNYGGNVVPQIIGPKVFQEYYMPHYQEAADILHKGGKLIGCHFDADNTPFMDLLAQTPLDYIEAYDPGISPSLSEAIRAFGDKKAIWINWPSPWHNLTEEQMYENTISLVHEAKGYNRLLVGVTEDVPEDRWQKVFSLIQKGIEDA